jgi:hypothetical protein
VTYLNSKPLTEHLPELFPEAVIRDDYPSRLADDLAAGKLDVALIPSIEYFRGEDYEIVSDACVAARGPVLSVKLYSRVRKRRPHAGPDEGYEPRGFGKNPARRTVRRRTADGAVHWDRHKPAWPMRS